jgi:hypothetical protein
MFLFPAMYIHTCTKKQEAAGVVCISSSPFALVVNNGLKWTINVR